MRSTLRPVAAEFFRTAHLAVPGCTEPSRPADVIDRLLADVFESRAAADLFNPYTDNRPGIDLPDAARIRRDNLSAVLRVMCAEPIEEIWIAEAPGHNGGARSGVPLIPESCFDRFADRTGTRLRRATVGPPAVTLTGEAVWTHLDRRPRLPLLWNTVLHHPHQPLDPSTNRTPTTRDIEAFASSRTLLREVAPDARVIAIGRVAERSWDGPASYVRHPAQGGRRLFDVQLREQSI